MTNMAFVLGIDPSRIRIVSVIAGSTRRRGLLASGSTATVDYMIVEDPAIANAPMTEKTFDTSKNIDASSSALPTTSAVMQNACQNIDNYSPPLYLLRYSILTLSSSSTLLFQAKLTLSIIFASDA